MPILTRRAALLALLALPRPLRAAVPPAIPGTFALPDAQARVSATLVLSPAPAGAPPGTRLLDVAMFPLGSSRPVTRFDVELSKRMHVIAVSDDLGAFLHEHGDHPAADGHFRVPMTFPHGGGWHVYADAVPSGLGQQVMRFDVDVDGNAAGGGSPSPRAVPQPTGLDGSDGRYGVRFDALDLRAGQEAQLAFHVLRDGRPAPDLTPFLGVAAHAVFVSAADLAYVHVHALPVAAPAAGGTGAPMHGDMAGMDMRGAASGMGHGDGGMHGAMAMGPPMRPGAAVAPDLALHLRAPKAGTYVLWLQFMAGGQVRTVRFVVAVA